MNKKNNIDNVMYDLKRKPLNGKKTRIAIILAAIFLIYCIILLVKLLSNPTNTFIVEQGKIYKEEPVAGYIIRDEQIVNSQNSNGKIVHLKAEGKKVAKGEAIYRYSLENEDELNNQISELDNEIQQCLQKETTTTLFSSDIKLLESQIQTRLDDVYENTNLQQISNYKKNISDSITKKAKIAGDLASNGSSVKELIAKRNNIEEQLNSNSSYVYADKSGIISYRVDELENILTASDFSYLNKDFLDSLNLRTSQMIATSANNAKIINNFNCYLTCITKTDEAKKSQIGDNIKLRLPSSDEISAEIVYKAEEGNDILLVFKIEKSVEALIDYRKINFDIIWWSDSGLKIPKSALQYEGNLSYVIRNRAGYQEKIFVKVLNENDNYAIVENYSTAELEEAGYDISTIETKKSISIYDEVLVNKKRK